MSDAARAERLKRMQWLATGLLAAMAVVFVVTSFYRQELPWLNVVWAFSEAALIGGLADWFAVTALFRRPLGLPIPHTAIVPTRKNEIGRALANFIADHFMVRATLEAQLKRLNLAQSLGKWLAEPRNASRLGRDASRAFRWLVKGNESSALRDAVKGGLTDLSRSIPTEQLIAALVDVFASGPHAQQLIDQLVVYGRDVLDRNKFLIRARIHEKSPWWLPRFVDEEIFDQLVGEIERVLDEIGDDAEHPARALLNQRLAELQASITDDPDFAAKGAALRDEFLRHPAVARFGRDVVDRTRNYVVAALEDPYSDLSLGLARELKIIGEALAADSPVAAELDAWLREATIYLVETYKEPISSVISTTIEQWDAAATSRRIELHIGRDLQFIRINGTLVGGLVGVILYLSWTTTIG
ncbi:MAG: DUF445 domain-containing protein [Gammaproteobacteria bacterium]|nr:DUF445 domain-containing protein [Gammaproteobacteria bacterium]